MIKVVCCGLPKTGTKSIVKAFDILGYRAVHHISMKTVEDFNIEVTAEGEAVYNWKEIYYKYPETKFILTTRSDWVERISRKARKIASDRSNLLRFGDKSQEFYDNHCNEIREFFSDKPDQFLEMNLFEGDGWKELCGFLGIRCKRTPFPNVKINRTSSIDNINRLKVENRGGYRLWE